MKDSIASTRILCVRPSGERLEVRAEIGRPYSAGDGAWACPVGLHPLFSKLGDIQGVDSLQALCLGASLIRKLLGHFVEDGGKILYPDDPDHDFDLEATFSLIGARDPNKGGAPDGGREPAGIESRASRGGRGG